MSQFSKISIGASALGLLGAVCASTHAASTYYVGNSLTYDANWDGINTLNKTIGADGAYGYHIKCGSGLNTIYTQPTDVCVPDTTYGTFNPALASHAWDRVSLEPYYDTTSKTTGAADRFRDFVQFSKSQGLNTTTNYYLYAAWPTGSDAPGFNYSSTWTRGYDPADSSTMMTRDYFSQIYGDLNADPGLNGHLFVVPAGEVIYALDQRMKAGQISGFTSAKDLYRDSTHFNDYGRYTAALTMFAVMNKTSPVGQIVPGDYQNYVTIDDATRLALQTAVWDVVSTNSAITGVPEPTAVAGLALVAAATLRRRRRV